MTHNTIAPAISTIAELGRILSETSPMAIQLLGEYLERTFVLFYEDQPLPPELGAPVNEVLLIETTESLRGVLSFNGYTPTQGFLDWHTATLESTPDRAGTAAQGATPSKQDRRP